MVNEFSPIVGYNFKVDQGVTSEKLNAFFDGRNYFMHIPNILCEFAQQDYTPGAQHDADRLNISKSTLYA